MKINVNTEIAFTHLLSRKKQTIVAILGVTIAIAMYIFINSLSLGVNRYSDSIVFKSTPHIRIYKDDQVCAPFIGKSNDSIIPIIINPKIYNLSKTLVNPLKLIDEVKKRINVVAITPMVTLNVFYNNGKSQLEGVSSGVNIREADTIFNIQSTMVEGELRNLINTPHGIIIGIGIADNLNIKLNDNISITSSRGINKMMKVVGIFKASNSSTDKSKSYINLAAAQELLQQGPSYVTDIDVNISDPSTAPQYIDALKDITGYNVEDWQSANEAAMTANKVRIITLMGISWAILLVAAFGIYNILNMTISQKLKDIAILKATGFSGKDVVKIFVGEALIMGVIGTCVGFFISFGMVNLLGGLYVGGDIGHFPIQFEPSVTINGVITGISLTLFAGYIPARKAAKVDPIEIFRK